jgi:ferredoxin
MINEAILEIVSRNYRYSVEGQCNGCQLCEFLAVNNFASTDQGQTFKVAHQPSTWEEKEQCLEAFERCPIHGISRTEVS